jgi:predicted acyltransferase
MIKQRFYALDIMRGATLALMILVNTPGSWVYVYPPLLHADWHGFTPTDFVFPFFLFMVGSSLYFSQRSLLQQQCGHAQRWQKIIKRTVMLFAVGLFLNSFPFNKSIEEIRILGVLQRIALAYGIAAIIVLYAKFSLRVVISIVLLLGYWFLLQLSSDPYSLEHSVVRQVDLWVLGPNHLWMGKGIPFDPEGLLSTFPAVVNVLVGFEVARELSSSRHIVQTRKHLALVGCALLVLALLWDNYFPINKSLWTSPFVLLTSGMGILVLLLLIRAESIGVLNRAFSFFIPLGKNPLFIYALSYIWETVLYRLTFEGKSYYELGYQFLCRFFNYYNASLAFALIHILMFWGVAKWMSKKGMVISL